jgi:Tfp pilus assembly protein PilF
MMGTMGRMVVVLCWLWSFAVSAAQAQPVPDEARRHMLRGQAALEMAKTPQDLKLAIRELEQATRLAPDWADAHFNLGLVRAKIGDYAGAIASYTRYLELAPEAPDAAKVRDELVKLEFRQERVAFQKDLQGEWLSGAVNRYNVTVQDGVLRISTKVKQMTGKDIESLYGPIIGRMNMPVVETAPFEVSGTISGDSISGEWKRGSYKVDACEVPADSGRFTGEIGPGGDRLTLRFNKKRFRILNVTSIMRMGDSVCTENVEIGTEEEELVLLGPLGRGQVRSGIWFIVAPPNPEQGAYAFLVEDDEIPEGLHTGDVLLSIDGHDMRRTTLAVVWLRLHGEPGTSAQVEVWRPSTASKHTVALPRAIPQRDPAGGSSAACFIATAAYGSPLEEHVATLREFRDRHLLTNAPGRWFVAQYYELSPPVADYIRERENLRAMVRGVLTPVVFAVNSPWLTLLLVLATLTGWRGWRRYRVQRRQMSMRIV